jgi:hypothetical protein
MSLIWGFAVPGSKRTESIPNERPIDGHRRPWSTPHVISAAPARDRTLKFSFSLYEIHTGTTTLVHS